MVNSKLCKSQQTQQRIMDVYLDTMREKHWDKITVRELCDKLSISRATFYQYYMDLYDLLDRVEEPLLQELLRGYQQLASMEQHYFSVNSFDGSCNLACPPQFSYWFQFCQQHERAMGALLGPCGEPHFISKVRTIIQDQLIQMMERDKMPNDVIRTYFLEALVALLIQGAQGWLIFPSDRRPDVQLVLNPINMIRIGGCYAHYQAFCNCRPPQGKQKISSAQQI